MDENCSNVVVSENETVSLNCSVSNDDDGEGLHHLQDCGECLIPDEDSFIEIELTDARDTSSEGPNSSVFGQISEGFVFQEHEIMEVVSDSNEEDNLIEIDINMGSIKCSSFAL
ncbi:Immunoglobulin-like fold-containing protein [Dioscorea alata]|uniref:Immunoglobulin-like fold-containing protein n=1 Tax=Dioscorea alata TaxID=55571 RepID=A0ACB7WNT9_DIOAL|nr:Immunoglobulin-like fold-containing protein [Dioscorea alata]